MRFITHKMPLSIAFVLNKIGDWVELPGTV
jgi:hypothetical protein